MPWAHAGCTRTSQVGLACALGAFILLATAGTATAQATASAPATASSAATAAAAAEAEKPSDAPLPSCLDQTIRDQLGQTLRPRGVQKRDFAKDKHLELVAHGGLFAGDLGSSSYLYGGALLFYFTEDLGIEARFDVTPVALDLDAPLAEFFGDDRFEAGNGYLALANLVWSPIHAKLKIGESIIHSDLMLVAGGGRLFHDSVQGVNFDAGIILDMFTSKWITFRFDLRDVIGIQEAVGETRLTNNIVATAGIALWIPTGL
jgi:outer membrane beta-barrel protein